MELDLNRLSGDHAAIPKSWLLSLLQPAMSNKMQDSIRSFVGGWIMRSDISNAAHTRQLVHLLNESILPWATRGALFTGSIHGTRELLICEHGQTISAFIARLLRTKSVSAQTSILQALLNYLARVRYNIMPHAMVYITQGICAATGEWRSRSMDRHAFTNLVEIALSPGIPEVVRDLLTMQCRQISSGISTEDTGEENVRKLNALHEQYDKLITGDQPLQTKAWPDWSRIEDMRLDIQATKSACLKGRGLNHACYALQQMLDVPGLQASAEELLEVLEAIWEQIEIQDYPKAALIGLPSIYLHLKCVQRSFTNEELQMKLSFFVTEYRKLVAGRIYTWTPLMVALRQAIIAYPDFALVADLETIVKDTVRSPPSPKPEFIMDLAVANQLASFSSETSTLTYEHYYGKNEGVGWAAFFDLLNSIIQLDPELNQNLLDGLLQPWMQQRIPPTIVNKWKTTEWVQALLILLQGRSAVEDHDGAKAYTQKIMYLLSIEPLPRYRFLFEWMICLLIQQHEDLMDLVVEVLSSIDHHDNPKYLSSIVRVAVTIVCSKLGTEDAAEKVVQRLTGLAASSKIIIRHEAQWALPTFWRHAQAQNWKTITENSALIGLLDYMHSLERTIVPSAERKNSRFNFDTDQTMSTLLCGSYLALEPPGKPQLKLGDYQRLMETEKGSTLKHPQDTKASLPWGTEPRLPAHVPYKDLPSEKKQPANEDLIALQTKGTSYLSGTIADIKSKRHNSTLLVVGSLVDNPYNLGGLSRVSEIFGAAALYVASTKVLTHKDFESVAVSSHLHFDVRDLPVADMIDFFTKMRLEGYAIVGIEQTDRSKILGQADTVLPRKTILVLGAEKEGMPATILGECDLLVEIPQRGSTRSMNVQTAASCVLFDYCRQHK